MAGPTLQRCPSADDLAAFVDGSASLETIDAHLDACASCRRIVSALAGADDANDAREAPPSRDIAPGETLGRFRTKRLLGHGGMGEVWAAYDAVLDRDVAVKLLRLRHEALGTEATARLEREAKAMARLRHPNVVAIYDLGSAGDRLFCAMELVDGVTLRAWLDEPRPWRDIFEVLLGVGRGIAAAHAAGLVHRDIKPDNVLITRDGRPLVTDFGLAKVLELDEPATSEAPDAAVDVDAGVAATVRVRPNRVHTAPVGLAATAPLTTAGTIIGTPAYMPLEQLQGRSVGPASDQFSFCVTAYEALLGVRPFAGRTLEELVTAVEAGTPAPPRRRGVPRALVRCLERGLARAPADRFPSIDALLDALIRAARGGRRRLRVGLVAGGLTAVGAAIALAASLARTDPHAEVRAAARGRMSEVWGSPAREALRAHFLATGAPSAEDQLALVLRGLDSYRTSWLAARVDAWAATRVRGEQSQDTLERRVACLERMASAMQATVRVLGSTQAAELVKARDVVAALPDLAHCADPTRLAREHARPSTPSARALDAELHALEVLIVLGRTSEARARATAAIAAIEASNDRSRLPRAVFNLGWIEASGGHHAAAEAQLRRALELGAAAQDHALVARIWLRLFSVIGFEQRRPDAALALEPAVRAAVLQAGDDPLQKAELAKTLGLVESVRGNYAAAQTHFVQARADYVAAFGADHYDVALADINIASVVLHRGELEVARTHLERAIAAFTRDGGLGRHPTLAQAYQNLCAVTWRASDWAASERHCRAAAELYDATLAAHPLTAKSYMFLGRALRKLRRLPEAQQALERARDIQTRTMPASHPERIQLDVYVAQIAEERGHYAEAEALGRKALANLRAHAVPERVHPFTLSELARIVAHRDPAEALDLYDEALRIHVAIPERDRSGEAELLAEIARVALAAKQPRRALAWFDKLPEAAADLADVRRTLVDL